MQRYEYQHLILICQEISEKNRIISDRYLFIGHDWQFLIRFISLLIRRRLCDLRPVLRQYRSCLPVLKRQTKSHTFFS